MNKTRELIDFRPLYDDLLFKEGFARKENRIFLEYFLETMLGLKNGAMHNKLIVNYESPIEKMNSNDKSCRGDLIIIYNGVTINLEAFTSFDIEALEKTMCYAFRLASNIEIGQSYKEIKPLIQMVFIKNMKIKFSKDTSNHYQITNTKNICDTLYSKKFQLRYYRLDNVKTYSYNEDIKMKWLHFIGASTKEEREKVAKGDDMLMAFNQNLNAYTLDEKTRQIFREWDRDIMRHQAERSMKEAEKTMKEAEKSVKEAEKSVKEAEKSVKEAEKSIKEAEKSKKEAEEKINRSNLSLNRAINFLVSEGVGLDKITEVIGLDKKEIELLQKESI